MKEKVEQNINLKKEGKKIQKKYKKYKKVKKAQEMKKINKKNLIEISKYSSEYRFESESDLKFPAKKTARRSGI